MNYLITGGAGFIGSNLLNYLVNKYNDNFICLDKLTYAGNINNLKNIIDKPNFKFIKGDICNKLLVDEIFNKYKINYVINLAAESHVDRSIINPDIFIKTNVLGVNVLLDLAKKYNVKMFYQISTDEVYGSSSNYCFKEEDKLNPTSPYSASKASADLLVLAYHKTYGLNVLISRSSNNYGIYQYHEKLIPLIITKVLKNEFIPIYGDGCNKRNYLHVCDHVKAIDLLINKGENGEIYNICSNEEFSSNEVVKYILTKMNKEFSLIKYIGDRLGHDKRYLINSDKIRKLGFKEEHSFSNSIDEIINYYSYQ